MSIARVLERAEGLGADLDMLVVGREVNVIPHAPSHRWIVLPTSTGGVVIGGMDRGTFASYARFEDHEDAAVALTRLLEPPVTPVLDRPAARLRTMGAQLSSKLAHKHSTGESIPTTSVPAGTPLDHIGIESGHCLFLFDTPMEQRSAPPTDLNESRVGYVLAGALPGGVTVSRVPPWFGQPGGGIMITLDRVIAYYCDTGLLERFQLMERARAHD